MPYEATICIQKDIRFLKDANENSRQVRMNMIRWQTENPESKKYLRTKWSPLAQNSQMFLTCQLDDRTKRSHHLCPFLCAGACKHLPAFLCMSKPFIHKILKLQSNKYGIKHYSNATLKPSKGHLDLCVAHNFLSKKYLPNTCIDLKTCFQPYAMWGIVRFISVLFKPAIGPWKKFRESCEY
jgi:hypothetical protein